MILSVRGKLDDREVWYGASSAPANRAITYDATRFQLGPLPR